MEPNPLLHPEVLGAEAPSLEGRTNADPVPAFHPPIGETTPARDAAAFASS